MTIFTTGANDLPAIAERNRNAMTLQAGPNGPLHVFDGVHNGLAITKTSGMGFTLGPGRAAVNASASTDGTLTAVVTADEPGAFEANDTAADRNDLVVLQSYPGNPSQTGVKVEVVKGITGSTDFPPVPAGAIPLWGITITAGTTAANGGWNPAKLVDRRRKVGIPEFIDYTPTWGNFQTLGSNFHSKGRYRLDGDKVSVHVSLEAGAGGLMGGSHLLYFSLPLTASAGYIYYGNGGLRTSAGGLAYDLRVLSAGGVATMHSVDGAGALVGPGSRGYPFGQGTLIDCNLEYFVDLQ